jgi:hypothetical protein
VGVIPVQCVHKDGGRHPGLLRGAHARQDHRVHQRQVDRLPSDFITHVFAEAWRGEDAEDEPQGEPRDLGRPATSVVIGDELEAGRDYCLALLRMPKYTDLMTPAL